MTTAVLGSPVVPVSPVRPGRLAVGAGTALVLNLASFGIGQLADASWDVGQPYALNAFSVIAATLVTFGPGGLVAWAVARRKHGFVKVAGWGGLIFGLLSMGALVNAADLSTGLSLGVMHVVTAGAWVLALLWNREGRA